MGVLHHSRIDVSGTVGMIIVISYRGQSSSHLTLLKQRYLRELHVYMRGKCFYMKEDGEAATPYALKILQWEKLIRVRLLDKHFQIASV